MTDTNVTPIRRRKKAVAAPAQDGKMSSAALDHMIGMARALKQGGPPQNPFAVNANDRVRALHPNIPKESRMALDDAFGAASPISSWAWDNMSGLVALGMVQAEGFLGFPALASLSQKPEHRRISETLATEMTRKWIKLTAKSDEKDKTDRLKELNDELERLKVRDHFRTVAEHDSFYGRGHIFIDLGAEDDGELLAPVGNGRSDISRNKITKGSLKGLRTIEPVWAYPNDYNSTDPLAPDFYKPQTWYMGNRRIHHSRMLTFIGRPVSDLLKPAYSFGGIPMTQLARLYVDRWERICSSICKLIESFSTIGFKTKLAEAMTMGGSADNLVRRIKLWTELRNNAGSMVLDKEEDMFNVVTPLGTLDQLQAQSQEQIAAIAGLPLVKYLGLSPHGLNATAEPELRAFYDWIHAYQERFFSNGLDTIIAIAQLNIWGEVDEAISYTYEPLWTSSEMEQSQVRTANANTDKAYIDAGVVTALEVRKKVANDEDMPYAGLDLGDAPDLSESERAESATKMASPILQAFSEGIIDAGKALEELAANGLFKTVDDAYINERKDQIPDPGEMMQPPGPGEGAPGGAPVGGGGPQVPRPPGAADPGGPPRRPPMRVVGGRDESPFDLGRLSKLDAERLMRAISEQDYDTIRSILLERETYRGAWDLASNTDIETWQAGAPLDWYHGSPVPNLTILKPDQPKSHLPFNYVYGVYLSRYVETARVFGRHVYKVHIEDTSKLVPDPDIQDMTEGDYLAVVYQGEIPDVEEVTDPSELIVNADHQIVHDFNEGEARAPKGSSTGGQWTAGGAGSAEGAGDRIATRVPKRGKADMPGAHSSADAIVGLESSKANPKAYAARAALVRTYPNFPKVDGETDDATVERFINQAKSNILALHDAVPGAVRQRSKLWYEGAHKIATDWAKQYNKEPRAVAACLAALSPQKDWFQNVSLAKRILDTLKDQQETSITPEMQKFADGYIARTAKTNPEAAHALQKQLLGISGHKLKELTKPTDRALFVRLYDEAHNDPSYPVVTPEGGYADNAKTDAGENRKKQWGAFDSIAKAISALDNPDRENISALMGGNHKVRNFYNNIASPGDNHGDVTVDTHAIAAAHLRPLGGNDKEVQEGLGMSGPKDAATGTKGLYGLYAEAYRRAAGERKILPREMQSITWEAIRGLMGAKVKGNAGKDVQNEIKGVWDDYANGKIKLADAQKKLLAVNGGIKNPDWVASNPRRHDRAGPAADTRKLHRNELSWSAAGTVITGGRGRYPGIPPLVVDAFNEAEARNAVGEWTSGGGSSGGTPTAHHPKLSYKPNDGSEDMPAQLSWEAAPGNTTKHMPEYHGAPLEVRRAYQDAVERVLNDDQGHDIIAQRLGLKTGPTFSAAGVFKGKVNPGAQGQVVGELSPDDEKKVAASEAIRALLLRQDAWAWSKPQLLPNGKRDPFLVPGLKDGDKTTFASAVGKPLTHADALAAMPDDQRKAYVAAGKHQNDANFVFKNDKGQTLGRVAARQYAEKEGLLNDAGAGYKQAKLISEHLKPEASSLQHRLNPRDANMLDFRMGRTPSVDEAAAVDKAMAATGVPYAVIPTPQGMRVLNVGDTPNLDFQKKVQDAMGSLDNTSLPDEIEYHLAHSVGGYGENDWEKNPHGEAYREAIKQAGPDVQRVADALISELGPKLEGVESDFAKKQGWTPDDSSRPWKPQTGIAEGLLQKNKGYPEPDQLDAKVQELLQKTGTADKVAAAREKMKTAVPTNSNVKDGGFKQDDGTYTPEREALHEQVLSKLFTPEAIKAATPAPGERPTMTILGGRGGSGKSWVTSPDGPVDRSKHIVIDSDAFKQALPEYQGWNAGAVHEESSDMADRAASMAKKMGLNVVFDQTMKSGTSAPKRMDQFKDTHDLHGYYVHATPEVAAERALNRFKGGGETGRFVPPEYVLGAHNNEKNFDAVTPQFKKWAVYDNNGEKGAPKMIGGSE